ncbi:MAG: hypothetical protein K2N22_04105 [Clostridia bacterium]|nr:hypothetical protein [Clostridia bacterium]
MMNSANIQKLIEVVKQNNKNLPYVNLDEKGNYAGWVSDFHIIDKQTLLPIKLNLSNDNDLFVLFALAACWSRTGQWENSACFAVYLKMTGKDNALYWKNSTAVLPEKSQRHESAKKVLTRYDMAKSGEKVSFRSDFYDSLNVLAQSWETIKESLLQSESKNDYCIFIQLISNIQGLGARSNRMRIKVPLLLRELRIQNTYKNIPGKWCCVPDQRVRDAAKNFSISLPTNATMQSILKSSEIIYSLFGDLYDIPLFAYDDIKDCLE